MKRRPSILASVLVIAAISQSCRTAESPGAAAVIRIGDAAAAAGAVVSVPLVLSGGGGSVAALRYDLVFDPAKVAPVAAEGGAPDCQLGAAVGPGSRANKQLQVNLMAEPDGDRKILRVVVIGMNAEPIPDGTILSCSFRIDDKAGAGPVRVDGAADAASPRGETLQVAPAHGTITIQ